jgi:hypothetical protein
MTNNVKEISACTSVGQVLFNSSGNTGTSQLSQVEADKPVILHQVCFQVPAGESVTIMEDQLTDLTTSIDVAGSGAVSEFPEYVTQTITRPRYDAAKPAALLDFQSTGAGDRIAQLDWSVSNEKDASGYIVERSQDGQNFMPVGEVQALPTADAVKGYQFVDSKAAYGKNHYRLQMLTTQGATEFSPVRTVTFYENPLTVSVSPNPADDFILVDVLNAKGDYNIRIMDVDGQLMKDHRSLQQTRQAKLDIQDLNPGVYLILVHAGDESCNEKLVITK